MAYTAAGLIHLISLVDRPDRETVVTRAKRAFLMPHIVRPLAAAALAYLLLAVLTGMASRALAVAVVVGLMTAVITFLDDKVMTAAERNRPKVAMTLAVIGLFCGLAVTLLAKKEAWIIVASGAGGFGVAWLLGHVGLALCTLAVSVAATLLKAFASPVAVPVLAMLAASNNRRMRTDHKDWVTSRGSPIVQSNRAGVAQINHDGEALFVSSSRLRMGGGALAAGIPLFTMAELSNGPLINQRISAALQTFDEGLQPGGAAPHPFMDINPATGLPMVDGIGSVDVMGNVYGMDNHFQNAGMDMGCAGADMH